MSTPSDSTRFTPLNSDSQGGTYQVLFYDSDASLDDLYETLSSRLLAVYDLLESLFEFKNPPPSALSAVAVVASLLLSDVNTLLEEFSPAALKLRAQKK